MANNTPPQLPDEAMTEMQRYVTQQRGTEPPYSGNLLENKRTGQYHCLVCHAPLFYSDSNYDSGCGSPTFYEPVSDEAIRYLTGRSRAGRVFASTAPLCVSGTAKTVRRSPADLAALSIHLIIPY